MDTPGLRLCNLGTFRTTYNGNICLPLPRSCCMFLMRLGSNRLVLSLFPEKTQNKQAGLCQWSPPQVFLMALDTHAIRGTVRSHSYELTGVSRQAKA